MPLQTLNIALADDDEDDRTLFKEAMSEIKIKTKLSLFNNGKELMDYLTLPNVILPEIVFLDLNMPIKNGMQCLNEIRNHPRLQDLLVAIYSTSSSEADIEETFVNGANIYINKPNSFGALKQAIEKVLQLNWQYHTSALNKDNFLLRI
ncbi:response regulator receiver domain-containing protein [Arenibacter algicola]|jgi:CheY-like chemotaxis protein|uniref:Response regulator rcp1 n=1 Tax=Arenibacter algicola TaxID=616991 RepID=A0A221UYM7_9FLAO|nr:response regulator [Arenibacter algicola]ASO06360.1 response regulator rcp1 [Arenibacter algicola]MBD3661311.1 response regulator [Arenibacter algicola]MDX1758649.1 response regulator [Arenibacter algicola]|tara:strand:+ start:1684 stop:2130 length:447 start_codon:yes stop_codon:yes gene_type:complete